ncbi:MAG: TraR/DksA C4-type zinc finger protein [Anaerolineae bacterium]|jgi:RNA polymerase-binding transcription factor DksA
MSETRNEEVIAQLKSDLAEAKAELAEYTDEATHPPQVELGGGSAGYSTWQSAVVVRQHIEKRIEEFEDALERAEQGLYGICEECGKPIPAERLQAIPSATLCVECAGKISKR